MSPRPQRPSDTDYCERDRVKLFSQGDLFRDMPRAYHGTRSLAIIALGQIGDEPAIQALIVAVRQNGLEERGSAAMKLGKLQAAEAVPALLGCVDEDDYDLQMSALYALRRIGDERAIPRVAELAETARTLGVSTRATDVTETDRHLRDGRVETYLPPDTPALLKRRYSRPRKVKWTLQKWAARRFVELGATQAAPAVEKAAKGATSIRERLLLRRTARRLRQAAA
jgi:HEAT repeat protein